MHRPLPSTAPPPSAPVLGWVVGLTVVCWLPYFSNGVIPFHDSRYVCEAFHYFYSEWLFHGELARWLPYGNFGMQADAAQNALNPLGYVVGLVGSLLGVTDTLRLFKTVMLLQELILAVGLCLLGKELYVHRLTMFVVALSGALSVSWLMESLLNFNVFYLLPLLLCCLLRFFKTGNATWLWLAGIVQVGSLPGSVLYFAPLQMLVLLVIAAMWSLQYPQSVRGLGNRRTLINLALPVLLLMAVLIGEFAVGLTQNMVVLSPGRDPLTGRVLLETFLDYGRPPVETFLFATLTGGIPHGNNTYYVGLLPLAGLGYALFTERRPLFWGLVCGFVLLFWLSIGGVFARAVFLVPGMNLCRHIGLTFGIGNLLLLLAGGFGVDRLASMFHCEDVAQAPRFVPRCLNLLVAGSVMLLDWWWMSRPPIVDLHIYHPDWLRWLLFRAGVWGVAVLALVMAVKRIRSEAIRPASELGRDTGRAGFRRMQLLLGLLCLPCLLDMGSFRAQVLLTAPKFCPAIQEHGVFTADRIRYLPERDDEPPTARARTAAELRQPLRHYHNSHGVMEYAFARLDPCWPKLRYDFVSRGVFDFFQLKGADMAEGSLPPGNGRMLRYAGCHRPKLRLTRQVRLARTPDEARQFYESLEDPDELSIIEETDVRIVETYPAVEFAGTFQVESFSANRLKLNLTVTGETAAWLIYADAWSPGWRATVDGQDARICRAQLGFKSIHLQPGPHVVELRFAPRRRTTVARGVAIMGSLSGLLLIGVIIGAIWSDVRSTDRADPGTPQTNNC